MTGTTFPTSVARCVALWCLLTVVPVVAGGQAGARGVPKLWSSSPVLGTTLHLHLENAAPQAVVFLGFSGSDGPTTIPGVGTFDLGADLIVVYFGQTDATGRIHLALPLPGGTTHLGLTAHWQAAVFDTTAPGQFAISTPRVTSLRTARYLVACEGDVPGPGSPGTPGNVVIGDASSLNQTRLNTPGFPHKILAHRDLSQAYAVSRFDVPGQVLRINPVSGQYVATITVTPYPQDIALSADDRYLLVLGGTSSSLPDVLEVYRTTDQVRVASFSLSGGGYEIVIAGADHAVVLGTNTDLFVVDLEALKLNGPIPVGVAEDRVLFAAWYPSEGGPLVYVLAGQRKSIFPIPPWPKPGHLVAVDVDRVAVSGSVGVGTHPMAAAPVKLQGGPGVAVLNLASRDVTVVDVATLKVLRSIPLLPQDPGFLAGLPDQSRVGVVTSGLSPQQSPPQGVLGTLEIVDAETGQSIRQAAVAADVQTGLDADTATAAPRFWVLNRFAGTLDRFHADTGLRVDGVVLGMTPVFISVQ